MEPIAVIGYSLRFPQDATSSETFWKMMAERRCAMTDWPKDRLNSEAFRHSDNDRPDVHPVKGAHFLSGDLGAFDASFFSITPAEAISMDIQQRGVLETTYRALENAGLPMENVYGTRTSVHTGSFADDYKFMVMKDLETLPKYAVTGLSLTLLANRLSWFYGFTGPSANVDTACSSSLMALDLGCQGLRDRTADMAIVAGSSSLLGLELFLTLGNMGFLSPDGLCYSFDSRANGYARGEGYGVVVLKRLSDALDSNDVIRAVIRSTGSNQDGHTSGITNPSQTAQENLIRQTYAKAGLELDETSYFEAHGTGTLVGDLIESTAIGNVFGRYRSKNNPLYVGAVKSNIGHLEGASGVAGLIKTIMILERGLILPNTNFRELNPSIDAEFFHLAFPSKLIPWPGNGLRRASLNSFGFGGSNAHAVIEDAYNYFKIRSLQGNHTTAVAPLTEFNGLVADDYAKLDSDDATNTSMTNGHGHVTSYPDAQGGIQASNGSNIHLDGVNGHATSDGSRNDKEAWPRIFILSAADKAGITRLVDSYTKYFSAKTNLSPGENQFLENLAYTLSERRSLLPWRASFLASRSADLHKLTSLLSPTIRASVQRRIGYVFTGQGAQYYRMGCQLLRFHEFKKTLLRVERYLHEIGCQWSLIEKFHTEKQDFQINDPEFSQTLCTALQIALVDLLRTLGLECNGVIGHSSGEIAGAYAVGALSLESACRVAYYRGKLAGRLASASERKGSMMSVGLSEQEAQSHIDILKNSSEQQTQSDFNGLVVACINCTTNVTISGPDSGIERLKQILSHNGTFTRKLAVDVAYHSPQMQTIAHEYASSIGKLCTGFPTAGNPNMISSVTGRQITTDALCKADYWVKNMVSPVRFSEALSQMVSKSTKALTKKLDRSHRSNIVVSDLLEVGPHSTLQKPIKDILAAAPRGSELLYYSALNRNLKSSHALLTTVGALYCAGYPISLSKANNPSSSEGDNRTPHPLVDLPEYPFDHSRSYWCESRLSTDFRLRSHPRWDLLGTRSADWNSSEAKWRKFTRVSETPWVKDHKINGVMIYPGAGMLVMAMEGAHQLAEDSRTIKGIRIKDATFSTPWTVSSTEDTETQLYMRKLAQAADANSGWYDFRIYIHKDGRWSENCRGRICVEYENNDRSEMDLEYERLKRNQRYRSHYNSTRHACQHELNTEEVYKHINSLGINLGPTFQTMQNVASDGRDEAVAEVRNFDWSIDDLAASHYPIIHPTTLDAVAQIVFVALTKGCKELIPTTIPTRINELWVSGELARRPPFAVLQSYTKSQFKGLRSTDSNIFALDKDTGNHVVSILGLETTTVSSRESDQRRTQLPQTCFNQIWKPDVSLMAEDAISSFIFRNLGSSHPVGVLKGYLELLLHKIPNLKLLHIDPDGNGPKVDLLKHAVEFEDADLANFGLGLNDIEYTYTYGSDEGWNFTKLRYPGSDKRIISRACVVDQSLDTQGFANDYYDVVLIDNTQNPLTNGILNQVHKLLHKDGKIIIKTISEAMTAKEDLEKLTFNNSINGTKIPSEPYTNGHPNTKSHTKTNPNDSNHLNQWGDSLVLKESASLTMTCHYTIASARHNSNNRSKPIKVVIMVDVLLSDIEHVIEPLKYQIFQCTNLSCEVVALDSSHAPISFKDAFVIFFDYGNSPILSSLTPRTFSYLQSSVEPCSGILWINYGNEGTDYEAFGHIVDGFSRSLRTEYPLLPFVTLHLTSKSPKQNISYIAMVLEHALQTNIEDLEPEFLERDGALQIGRLSDNDTLSQEIHSKTLPHESKLIPFGLAPPLQLTIGTVGLLDTLQFVDDPEVTLPIEPLDIEIKVEAIGVNFMDTLTALGRIAQRTLGGECSGIVTRAGSQSGFTPGDRVCTAVLGCFQTYARTDARLAAKISNNLSFIHAAALPVTFVTAHYALTQLANLQKGESILIHSAAGGTGQAAIQLARVLGADVYVTVGSLKKKQLLMDLYKVPETHIFYSRDLTFAEGIMRMTGKGVDVVLNSLSGDGLIATWECIASFGRFVEIGKRDIHSHSFLPMFPFARNVAFHALDLATMSKERPEYLQRSLQAVMSLVEQGVVSPAHPLHIYSLSDTEDAFRYMQTGTNTGKTVIEVKEQDLVKTLLRTSPKCQLDSVATYVIAGGLGGLGRSVTQWMVDRGAKYLVLLSRSGVKKESNRDFVRELESQGVQIHAPACDICDYSQLTQTLKDIQKKYPPIKGCVQGTMVLKDALFKKMTLSEWKLCTNPKIHGSWNLHSLLPLDLSFFVFLSSISSIYGAAGQTNYAAGNAFMDSLARQRVSRGLKAISLNLGWMESDGVVAERQDLQSLFSSSGFLSPVSRLRFQGLLDKYCDPELPVAYPDECQVVIGLEGAPAVRAKGIEIPYWMQRPTFRRMHNIGRQYHRSSDASQQTLVNYPEEFTKADSLLKASAVLLEALMQKLSKALSVPYEDLDATKALYVYGVDSLLSVELRNWFAKDWSADMAIFDIMGAANLTAVSLAVAKKSKLRKD